MSLLYPFVWIRKHRWSRKTWGEYQLRILKALTAIFVYCANVLSCRFVNRAYSPSNLISSSWLPICTIHPTKKKKMISSTSLPLVISKSKHSTSTKIQGLPQNGKKYTSATWPFVMTTIRSAARMVDSLFQDQRKFPLAYKIHLKW